MDSLKVWLTTNDIYHIDYIPTIHVQCRSCYYGNDLYSAYIFFL